MTKVLYLSLPLGAPESCIKKGPTLFPSVRLSEGMVFLVRICVGGQLEGEAHKGSRVTRKILEHRTTKVSRLYSQALTLSDRRKPQA